MKLLARSQQEQRRMKWEQTQHIVFTHFVTISEFHSLSFQEPVEDEDEDEERAPNPPMMVPMADMLNHISKHNANLEYTIVSVAPIFACLFMHLCMVDIEILKNCNQFLVTATF